ncbi:UNVERIFIED_CONTAM: nucleoside-diphosphate-sugar epimerase [Brevibacillus sp. OAP136]
MKIFVAGAAGVIGRLLVPQLVKAGHEVIGTTRNERNRDVIQAMGAEALTVDVFDREVVFAALRQVQPDVVIHQLTSLGEMNFAENARIRVEGTRNLVDAAKAVGVQRMIAQSIAWTYEPGDGPAAETVPLDVHAPMPRKSTVDAVAALEHAVAEIPQHVILRYGMFYGPGTWYERGGVMAENIREQKLPATDGITSFLHVADAARAAVLALDWPTGAVNIVDDEPAAGTEWLAVYAQALGAPEPIHQPGANRGERGATNAKALNEYGWEPLYSTWRTGFAQSLSR